MNSLTWRDRTPNSSFSWQYKWHKESDLKREMIYEGLETRPKHCLSYQILTKKWRRGARRSRFSFTFCLPLFPVAKPQNLSSVGTQSHPSYGFLSSPTAASPGSLKLWGLQQVAGVGGTVIATIVCPLCMCRSALHSCKRCLESCPRFGVAAVITLRMLHSIKKYSNMHKPILHSLRKIL